MRESNKLVCLYTQKFGLIYATMQSLRELKSKMRYHVHAGSWVEVDLVAGKNIWRITGIHERISSFSLVDSPWYGLITVVSGSIIRLCDVEDANSELWSVLNSFMFHLRPEYNEFHREIELSVMIQILYSLGYWQGGDVFFDYVPYSKEIFEYIAAHRKELVQKINISLAASQL